MLYRAQEEFAASGISTSVSEARNLCPEAEFTETLHLTSSTLEQMQSRVQRWLRISPHELLKSVSHYDPELVRFLLTFKID